MGIRAHLRLDAYYNVQQVLGRVRHPRRPPEYVGHHACDAAYRAELEKLAKVVEHLLVEPLECAAHVQR
ncbi:hypothetical protein LVJ94_06965 [Pendulispora rubella]|uniref:Uncharacterized protein n=1 Tax=Pendulispora rubella TaxID=2741070 RepID=A0ABZ2LBN5_9BACT